MKSLWRRPAVALFFLSFGTYAWFFQAGGWNQNSRFDLTRAIVEHGTVRIDAYQDNTGDKAERQGHFYCDKAPLVSWMSVPAVWVGQALFGPPQSLASLERRAYLATITSVALPSAIAVALLMLSLLELGLTAPAATGAAAAWGIASLALPYSTLLYGHQLAAALLVIAFSILVKARRSEMSAAALITAGVTMGLAIACEYPAVLACAVLGVYALACVRPLRRVGWILAGGTIPAVALAAYHIAAFGGPLTTAYEFSTQGFRHMGFFMGLGLPQPNAIAGILISPYRGIFYSMPWLLLAIPGAFIMLRRLALRREALVCIAVAVLFFWLNISLVDWQGGWALGPPYLNPALPFLTILAAGPLLPLVSRRLEIAARVSFAALAAIAFALMLVGTAVKPEVPMQMQRPFDVLFQTFAQGRVAINAQSIDSPRPVRGTRHAWNIGEKIGLDGPASLLPLLLWIAITGAWATRAARDRDASLLGPESTPLPPPPARSPASTLS